jgi:hypothetical protein
MRGAKTRTLSFSPRTAVRRSDPTAASGPNRAAGITILELVIVSTLLTVGLGGAFTLLFNTQIGLADRVTRLTIDQAGWRALERLSSEIMAADPSTILPVVLSYSHTIDFNKVLGYDNGAPVLSGLLKFEHMMDSGESLDGADNNGDGRIDEGVLRYRQTNDGTPGWTSLVSNVTDLHFTSVTGGVNIDVQITLKDRKGQLVQRLFSQQVSFRNGP